MRRETRLTRREREEARIRAVAGECVLIATYRDMSAAELGELLARNGIALRST